MVVHYKIQWDYVPEEVPNSVELSNPKRFFATMTTSSLYFLDYKHDAPGDVCCSVNDVDRDHAYGFSFELLLEMALHVVDQVHGRGAQ